MLKLIVLADDAWAQGAWHQLIFAGAVEGQLLVLT